MRGVIARADEFCRATSKEVFGAQIRTLRATKQPAKTGELKTCDT